MAGRNAGIPNIIRVEQPYADAGKWKEVTIERRAAQSPEGASVAKVEELKVDQMKLIRLDDGMRIALARTEQGYRAFDDHCTHRGGSLADGVLICGRVQCLWHGSQFDCTSGEVRAGPAKEPIKTYGIEERDGEVRLKLP
jgi:nitrite reductase/ring-hydroxylating ferredoxin subunit